MTRTHRLLMTASLVLLLNAALPAAQDARDPTIAPPETGAALPSPTGTEGMTVLLRDDRPYLVVGTRLYAPGDTVGNLRVERITETEIWFHDGSTLSKIPRFTGIGRKAIAVKTNCSAPTPAAITNPTVVPPKTTARKKSKAINKGTHTPPTVIAPDPPPAVAPCEDTQP